MSTIFQKVQEIASFGIKWLRQPFPITCVSFCLASTFMLMPDMETNLRYFRKNVVWWKCTQHDLYRCGCVIFIVGKLCVYIYDGTNGNYNMSWKRLLSHVYSALVIFGWPYVYEAFGFIKQLYNNIISNNNIYNNNNTTNNNNNNNTNNNNNMNNMIGTIKNPYVIIIGIPKYNIEEEKYKQNLKHVGIEQKKFDGIWKDIEKIKNLFTKECKLINIYNQNVVRYPEDCNSYLSIKQINDWVQGRALHIEETNSNFEKNGNNQDKIDGLILFMSCHGFQKDYYIDSFGDKGDFYSIFNQFNSTNCNSLSQCPKLYFIDCCRNIDAKTQQFLDEEKKNCDYIKRGSTCIETANRDKFEPINTAIMFSQSDGKVVKQKQNQEGRMTKAMVKVFSSVLDKTQEKLISYDDIASEITHNVRTNGQDDKNTQIPQTIQFFDKKWRFECR